MTPTRRPQAEYPDGLLAGYGLPYWLDFERPSYPSLEGRVQADAAVIGAGIAGLKIADCLSGRGLSCAVLDAGRVGEGASSRNQGCIVTGLGMPYSGLIQKAGREMARALVALSYFNQDLLVEQMERHAIRCDYEVLGETGLVRGDQPDAGPVLESLRGDVQLLREDGFAAEHLDAGEALAATGSPLFAGGIKFPRDAQFHSGRFVAGLGAAVSRLSGVRLFEGSPVLSIEESGGDHLVRTPRGEVRSRHLFVAANALAPQLLPELTCSLRAERGQVLVTEPLAARPCRGCFGGGLAWWRDIREADGRYRLLFGGARRRDEPDSLFKQYGTDGRRNSRLGNGFLPTVAHQRRLHARLAEVFPHLAGAGITHRWGGLQSFTCDGLPLIGALDPERRVYGMAGFSGMGNSYSNVGAAYLADRAAGVTGEVERRFGPAVEMLLAPHREGARWPGPDPTLARSATGGVFRPGQTSHSASA